jgi:tRNA (guanine37-N1)-methyltransferase
MKITILTIFPEMFDGVFTESILKRAQGLGIVDIQFVNFREFSTNKHHRVDDYSFGGGPGLVLAAEPIYRALQSIPDQASALKILMTPQGEPYTQSLANELSTFEHIIIICGHYEGFDERILSFVDREISIGDYVLTGGEIGAMVLVDSITRLLPGVLSSQESYEQDSFYNGMLEYPQYTRPQEFMGMKVPDVLLNGNHAEIEKWRKQQSWKRTLERRPDLIKKRDKKD